MAFPSGADVPHIVTVSAQGNRSGSAGELFLRQMPASDRVVVLHAGEESADYVIRADEAQRNIRFSAIWSIRSTLPA